MTRMNSRLLGCRWLVVTRRNSVKPLKTHFEQVPVENVKELADLEIAEKEKAAKAVADQAEILRKEKR